MVSYARIAGLALGVALVAFFLVAPAIPLAVAPVERASNGQFEDGFDDRGLALDWELFDGGGDAKYLWGDEQWEPAIWDGSHGQSVTIRGIGNATTERGVFAGIWQTIPVEAGETYQLLVHGLLRAGEDTTSVDVAGCRVQWGVDYAGGDDWTLVQDWVDLPWDRVHPRRNPGPMATYSTAITAQSDSLSLFLRLLAPANNPASVTLNLDAISLKASEPLIDTEIEENPGPAVTLCIPAYPVAGVLASVHASASDADGVVAVLLYDNGAEIGSVAHGASLPAIEAAFDWSPAASGVHMLRAEATGLDGSVGIATQMITVGEMAEWIANGGFEEGFGADGVAVSWLPFESGEGATSRWEDGAPAAYRGEHAQRISLTDDGSEAAGGEPSAGIYQRIAGLRVGATYRLRLYSYPGDDACQLQYGLDPAGGVDWRAVSAWHILNGNGNGAYHAYADAIVAQAPELTLFLRGRVVGETSAGMCDFSVDEVSLAGYR